MCHFLPKKNRQKASNFRNLEDPGIGTDLLFAEDCGVFLLSRRWISQVAAFNQPSLSRVLPGDVFAQ